MSTPQSDTITLVRGDDKTYVVTVTDSLGVVVDLTSATIKFTVKVRFNDADADALMQKTTAVITEIKLTDPTNGIFEIYVVATDTQLETPKDYLYDIQIDLAGGKRVTPVVGTFTLLYDVTKNS